MKMNQSCSNPLPLLTAALTALGLLSNVQAQVQIAGPLFVDVDATTQPYGTITSLPNAGTLGGVFQGFSSPVIADSPGGAARGVQFNGTSYMQLFDTVGGTKIVPPAGLVGLNPTRSIEVWAYNPAVADEETLVAWGKRGGGDGSNMSFNYGLNGSFGAVGHWGAGPDVGWNPNGTAPAAGQWHHLVYTFDGATTRVYSDGAEANSEAHGAGVINTHANTSILLAAQLEADGVAVTTALRGSLFIAKARIHDGVLTPAQVLNNYSFERPLFTGPARLTLSPTNQTAVEGGPVTFTGQGAGDPPISFQWLRDGAPISGAVNNSYTIEELTLADGGAVFSFIVTNLVNATGVQSTNALLTVTPDTTAPVLVGAAASSQASLVVLDAVGVAFSEKISVASGTALANYSLVGPEGAVVVSGVIMDPGGRSVRLSTPVLTPGGSYTLTVNGLRDRAATANLIAADSQATFTAAAFALTNVGGFAAGSTVTPVAGGFDLAGIGRDIGGTTDEFGFHARPYIGDFDVQTRVEALQLSDGYSEAGLMARPFVSNNVAFAAVLAAPSLGGVKYQSRASTGVAAANSGQMPVNYPYTWLRLQRAGNVFSGLGSFDGETWQRLGSSTVAMPATVFVGFAVNSHQTNAAAVASFREPVTASGGTIVNTLTLPFEPLGPSTRRTGLVFSEIMYHPAEVPGVTNSLEYIEVFNAQDYFEDLTGYTIDGDIHYAFPPGTRIPSGGFLVIARDPAAVQAVHGLTDVLGPWRMTTNATATTTNISTEDLPNSRGTLRLENELGAHLLEVTYDTTGEWPVAPDGSGPSLVLARPSYGEGNAQAWAASERIGGSPGRRESFQAVAQRAVVINEFLAHTDLPEVDFIELFNTSTQPVDLSGCWLSDDFGTNKFRIADGTVVAGRSFVTFTETQVGFNLSSDGEEVILVNSNGTRVLDSLRYGGQENGVSTGRFPDGAPSFCRLTSPTPDTNNTPCLSSEIVLNEIMYRPISGNDDDEFIELHNRGGGTVNLSGWRLTDGVSFTLPPGTMLGAGGYLVVAKNRTNLLARYPDLAATPSRVVGNYGGTLANGGERIALAKPDENIRTNSAGFPVTNVFYITVNEVNYRDGGRWGQWSDGGGSSLELIDARADNRLAANWADSDETQKSSYTLIERTALIDLGMTLGSGTPNRFEMFLQGAGECLVDDLECRNNGGPNRITDPGFESGGAAWFYTGTQRGSAVQNSGARTGGSCLHLRAVERGDAGANRIRTAIAVMTTGGANTATLRGYFRWLRGETNVLMRIRGQWMECAGGLTVPTNLGTPGAPNSRAVSNAGPAISEVTHSPVLPAANEPVLVTARVHDADGLSSLTLRYRLDPAATLFDVAMNDGGTGGDLLAGDGVWSGTIPGFANGVMVAFHLRATDANGAPVVTTFPDDAPAREAHVRFGESLRPASIGTYRFWLTQSNITFWTTRERNSNEGLDCTFVYGNVRAIYNAKTLYSGSPFHTANHPYTGPLGSTTCDYELALPSDDQFLGTTEFVLNAQAAVTSFFDNDTSAQAESTAYWMGRKLGLGVNYKRHVFVSMNGQDRAMIYFDHQQPSSEIIAEYYPNDSNGRLYKIEDWFEFDDAGAGFEIVTATLGNFVVGGQKRAERYRFMWRPRAGTGPNDFNDLFALADAANATSPEPYTSAMLGLMDVRNWTRTIALTHMTGNWDSYGYRRGKNMFTYKPQRGPWRLVLWDYDLVLGKGSDGTTQPLMDSIGGDVDPAIVKMMAHPPFAREFWCAMQELVDAPMLAANYNPLIDARFAAFRANDVPVDTATAMKAWIDARRTFIISQIPTAAFAVTTANFTTASNYVNLSGTAPVGAKDILVNGAEYPITWTGVTTWTVRVPLTVAGANELVITGVNRAGATLGSRTNIVTYTGGLPDPANHVVINEIMFNPPVDDTSFIELFNTHTNYAFDLSNWRVNGLSHTFAPGSVIAPRSFLVLGRNRFEYAKTFGALHPFFTQFDGGLDNGGETLTLLRPGALPGEEIIVDKVKYEGRAPWPAAARGGGSSLQLIDAAQDNARVSNWSDGSGWRYFSFTGPLGGARLLFYLDTPGNLFIDDFSLVPGTVAGVGTNFIVNNGFEAPLLPAWNFQGTNVNTSTVSAAARLSGNTGLDLRFLLGGTTSQYMYQNLSNTTASATYTISFWYLPSTNANNLIWRVGSAFRGTINVRAPSGPTAITATPAATNSMLLPTLPYPLLWLNEVQPVNTAGLTNHLGQPVPWLELYNSSGSAISLEGLFLSDNYANLSQWSFPTGASLEPGEFKVVYADGLTNATTATEWHTSFTLGSGTGSVALSRPTSGGPQIIDYLNFDNLLANRSYGACPDGQLFDRGEMFYTTPAAANNCAAAPLVVYINEWMAANTGFVRDPADSDTDDWFEIYNPNAFTVDLGGYFLTDDLTNRFQSAIPNNGLYTIPPHGFLLVWADGETGQNSTNRADLHVNFNLRQAGESIGIFAADGTQIDAVTFGAQTNNFSEGRLPDGTGPLQFFPTTATPRAPNQMAATPVSPELSEVMLLPGGMVSFSFATVAGQFYRVEYKDDLNAVEWMQLGSDQPGNGSSLTILDEIGSNPQRFYRVVLVP